MKDTRLSRMLAAPVASPLTVYRGRQMADAVHHHARQCKDRLDDCQLCQLGMQWFAQLPLPTLALVLEDAPKSRRF